MSGGERKVGAREAKTALNSAATMAEVLRDAGELAKERELQFVMQKLSENDSLLFRLSGFLKEDSLIALLDGRMNATMQKYDEGSGRVKGPKPASAVLRQAWKKWEHIEGSTTCLNSLLRAAWGLEVNGDCPEGLKIDGQPADNKKLLVSFSMLMRQKSQWRMPHWPHEVGAVRMQEDLFAPLQTAGN